MLYFRIAVIVISALGLLMYTLIFDRRHFIKLLTIEVILSGLLAFYVYYHIGSYSVTDGDVELSANVDGSGDGPHVINMVIRWSTKPELFGYDGDKDNLIVRYDPEAMKVVRASRLYRESDTGKSLLKLPKNYQYSKLAENERELGFIVTDGADDSIKLTVKCLKDGVTAAIFFIHDYKVPLDSQVYSEKMISVNIN